MIQKKPPATVDEYINSQPAQIKKLLQQIRKTILEAAPKATEKISYGMPYYSLNGRLAYFMAHKNHIGFYPMKTAIVKFKKELVSYETAPGTVRFPLDKPLPDKLIQKIIEFRVKENLSRKK